MTSYFANRLRVFGSRGNQLNKEVLSRRATERQATDLPAISLLLRLHLYGGFSTVSMLAFSLGPASNSLKSSRGLNMRMALLRVTSLLLHVL
jgi:hypothetical protein